MATYVFAGYDDDDLFFPGGSPWTGQTITFTFAANHQIEITDNDIYLVDGTDDRDDEDWNQTAVVYDESGQTETSGQIQPRQQYELWDGSNIHVMQRVYIAASNSYYYIFKDPPPELNTTYTVTSVSSPNYNYYSAFSTTGVICFARGTRIDTPDGPRPVEWLRAGQPVLTLDTGPQPIVWIGRRTVTARDLRQNPKLRPFSFGPGTLGPDLPYRTLNLSRQHRVLLSGGDLVRLTGHPEALAAAHTQAALPGVAQTCPPFGVDYYHLLLPRHALVRAEGAPVESLLPGPEALRMMAAYGDAPTAAPGPAMPVRPILANRVARRLAENRAATHDAAFM
ncbi:Hint domain-containing protein [Rhodovulum sp. ES.010]|uniref:Hint domain-containing protein n=1 Tax=Rhodovulum sp. ES.010 TaxID=1882821 RepID=UPI0009285EDC|nr:Hint domain-containing protein [Rhodovulum sp. ES.010]SIO05817.1 Hint domain-containing protein [Rhodovulum sp. ES.010]